MNMPLSIHDVLNDRQSDKIKLSIYMIAQIYAKYMTVSKETKKWHCLVNGLKAIYPICKYVYKLCDLLTIPNKHVML